MFRKVLSALRRIGSLPLVQRVVPLCIATITLVVFGIIAGCYVLSEHYHFRTYYYDFGIFVEALQNTLTGKGLMSCPAFRENWSYLGGHVCFLALITYLPVYAISPRPETLLILHVTLLTASGVPLYLVARKRMGRWLSLVIVVAFVLNPLVHHVFIFYNSTIALATLLLFIAYAALEYDRDAVFYTSAILALLAREDTAAVIIPLCLYAILKRSSTHGQLRWFSWRLLLKDRRIISYSVLAVCSLLWLLVCGFVIMPAFGKGTGGRIWIRYTKNPGSFPSNIVKDPDRKLRFLELVFAPLAFLPFFDPGMLATGLIYLISLLAYPQANTYYYIFHYPSYLLPALFFACVKGAVRVRHFIHRSGYSLRLASLVVALLLLTSSVLFLGSSPIYVRTLRWKSLPSICYEARYSVLSLIPSNASLTTHNNILPHVLHLNEVYCEWRYAHPSTDYIYVDTRIPCYAAPEFLENVEALVANRTYGLYAAVDGVWLLKRQHTGQPLIAFDRGAVLYVYPNPYLSGEPEYVEVVLFLQILYGFKSPYPLIPWNRFSVRIEGRLIASTSGLYQFRIISDDGVRFFVDGELIADEWGPEVADTGVVGVSLAEGEHTIVIEWMEWEGSAGLYVYWKPPYSHKFEILNYTFLRPVQATV